MPRHLTHILLVVCFAGDSLAADAPASVVVRRYKTTEARQAVAVDQQYFFAINSAAIGKYDRATGRRLRTWKASAELPLSHLNSGIVRDGKLYCAHSNYPQQPATSSVEIWDAESLEHQASHSFGIGVGSLTWVDWHAGAWWAVFAHYSRELPGQRTSTNHHRTQLLRFDKQWRRTGGWVFPRRVLDRFAPHSCSGGGWGPNGDLYCTGHDRGELYRLRLPRAGSTLQWVETIELPITGQGIAFDRRQPSVVFGIRRPTTEVLSIRLKALSEVALPTEKPQSGEGASEGTSQPPPEPSTY